MHAGTVQFLQRWLITTVGVLVAANIVGGIHYDTTGSLLVASLLLGLLNAFVRPLLVLVSISLVLLTFGLGLLVINALLLWGVGGLVKGFHVDGFWAAFWGALIISFVTFVAGLFLGPRPGNGPGRPPGGSGGDRGSGGGGGPVIDV